MRNLPSIFNGVTKFGRQSGSTSIPSEVVFTSGPTIFEVAEFMDVTISPETIVVNTLPADFILTFTLPAETITINGIPT